MNDEQLTSLAPWDFSDYELIVAHLRENGFEWLGCGSDDVTEEWCKSLLLGVEGKVKDGFRVIDLGCGYARLLNYLLLKGLKEFSYYGIELPGPKCGDLLLDVNEKLYSHINDSNKKINFGLADDCEFINRAIEECDTLILGSVFTHLSVQDSYRIIKKYEKVLDKENGSIIFSVIMGDQYGVLEPNVYNIEGDGNPTTYGVTYYTPVEIDSLTTAPDRGKPTKITEFSASDHTQHASHTIYKLQYEI